MDNVEEKTTKKSKKGLAIVLAIVIIAALVGGYFLTKSSNPKNVFVSQINKTLDNYGTEYKKISDKINSTVTLTANIDAKEGSDVAQMSEYVNNSKLTLNVQADTANKKFLMAADVDYKNENFLNGKVYYQNGEDNIYVYVEDLFDKYFKIDLSQVYDEEELQQFKNLAEQNMGQKIDFEKISKILKQEIDSNFKDEYFSKETVDGMTKNTMKLTVKEWKTVLTNIITNLKNNQEYLNSFSNADEQKKYLEDALEMIKEIDEEDATTEISIFTKGFNSEFVKLEMKVTEDNKEEALVVVEKQDDSNFAFTVKDDEDEVKGTVKVEKQGNNMKLTVATEEIPDFGKLTLNIESKMEETTNLDSVDVSNSVDVNNMSQEDMLTLYTNLTKMKIYSLLGGFLQ